MRGYLKRTIKSCINRYFLSHAQSRITEIYTHVSSKNLSAIKNPLYALFREGKHAQIIKSSGRSEREAYPNCSDMNKLYPFA